LKFTNIDLFSASFLEKSLKINRTLVYLDLYSTGLSDIASSRVISALENNKTLIELDLGGNFLASIFCKSFAKVLNYNFHLLKVNLSKNYSLTDSNFKIVIEGLVDNQSLGSLGDLTDTKIGVKIRDSIDSILKLNQQFLEEGSNNKDNFKISNEFNKSLKVKLFNSIEDLDTQERILRESLEFKSEIQNG
jgi:hypothetical protein